MRTNLEWLITASGLKNIKCVAGRELLGTKLDGVSVIDSPNGGRWVRQNEFGMTTGYYLQNDEKSRRNIIRELKKAGCAGLGIKIKSYFDEIPADMIEEAEKEQLPLLEIPYYYALSEISQTIYNHIFETNYQARLREQRLIEDISDIFFSKRGVMEIVYRIAEYLKRTVVLTDGEFRCIYAAKKMTDRDVCIKGDVLQRVTVSEEGHDTFSFSDQSQRAVYCIAIPDVNSMLLVLEDAAPVTKEEEYLIGRCIKILNMGLEQVRIRKEEYFEFENIYYQKLYEYLNGLRQYTETELISLVQELEFPIEKKRIVLLIQIRDGNTERTRFREWIEKSLENCRELRGYEFRIFSHAQKYILYLFADARKNGPAIIHAAQQACGHLSESLHAVDREAQIRIGISKSSQGIAGIKGGYQEAQKAIDIGERLKSKEEVFSFSQLEIYDYLFQYPVKNKEQLSENIHCLVKYDEQNHTELTQTLMKFLECKFNMSETAKELYIHRNTLINRMNKIREILYCDLETMDTLVPLCMEACAYKLFS